MLGCASTIERKSVVPDRGAPTTKMGPPVEREPADFSVVVFWSSTTESTRAAVTDQREQKIQNRRGLPQFAEFSEQIVPDPFPRRIERSI
jgi:hypothetical protein